MHSLTHTLDHFLASSRDDDAGFYKFGLTNITLFAALVCLLAMSQCLSVFLGSYLDSGELILALSDCLFSECFGVSLISLLLVNPQLLEQFLRIFHLIYKLFNGLESNSLLPFLAPPALKSLEHTAHGCRAPPL